MTVAIDMEKLQMIIYYVNSVRMSNVRREELHRVVLQGILVGEVDVDSLFGALPRLPASNIRTFLRSFVGAGGNEGEIQAQDLYAAYVEWCEKMEDPPESSTTFGRCLKEMGVAKVKRADANYYQLTLEPEGEWT